MTQAAVADLVACGVQVREADYSHPDTMRTAFAAVDRLLLVSSSEAGQRVVHHTNVIDAANLFGVSRILYSSMLNTDVATNPFSADHLASELALRQSSMQFTLLRNGLYTEGYTNYLREYLTSGEILGATANGRICARTWPQQPRLHSFGMKVETRRTSLGAHTSISPSSLGPLATSPARG